MRAPLVAWDPGRIPAHSLALKSTGPISLGQTKSVFGVTRLPAQSAGEERAFAPGLVTSGRFSPTRLRFSSSPSRTRRRPLPPLLLPRAPAAACCLLSRAHRCSHRRLLISLVQPLLSPLHPCTPPPPPLQISSSSPSLPPLHPRYGLLKSLRQLVQLRQLVRGRTAGTMRTSSLLPSRLVHPHLKK
jgi:hypothetical protein